jgi:hypothetical protein
MFVWLSGRADTDGLRTALGRLSRLYPVVTSRLIETGSGRSRWQFRRGAQCGLRETTLDSAAPSAVLDYAGRLLSTPCDPAEVDPLRLELLHRPDGRDVLLLQYNHTLMDNHAAIHLVREIDRLAWDGVHNRQDAPQVGQRDLIRDYLKRFPLQRRKAAMRTLEPWARSFRGGVATLGQGTGAPGTQQIRIASRRLLEAETGALQTYVAGVCGFPSLSMALVGSAFRAIARLSPQTASDRDNFVAGIGIDLGLRGKQGLIFQNLASLIPVHVRSEHLHDYDALMRMLSRQMWERLASDSDLGMLQWTSVLSKRPRQTRFILNLVLRIGFSLWYGYFGAVDAVGDSFCGAAIEEVYYTGPSWSPVGMTLLANQFRGRLLLQASYVPDAVPEALANQFLDEVMADLRAGAGGNKS